MPKTKKKTTAETPKEETCPDCKRPAHEPGKSEFSNCGEGSVVHSRFDNDIRDQFERSEQYGDLLY